MLIRCPECELQVSDKAIDCPHCGYPMKPSKAAYKKRKTKHRNRLPNGFGQITELKGRNLRKPFRAMVTVGKKENGKPICKLLQPVAYFATYNEAYAALLEYNKNPYDLNKTSITVKELYEEWSTIHFGKISHSTENAYKSAWKYCEPLYSVKVADIRPRHIKKCMEDSTITVNGKTRKATANMKTNIKSIFNLMFDYAVEFEIIDKNYSRNFSTPETSTRRNNTQQKHMSFNSQEIKTMWEKKDEIDYLDVILIQCYSGWRPQELGLIQLKNVDIVNWTFSGGMKTEAGINRIVPIHPKIRNLVLKRYEEAKSLNSEYLFNCQDVFKGRSFFMDYERYRSRFEDAMLALGFENHRPHDGRKHFVTQAKKYELNEYAIKYIVGHVIDDVTEKVYTERELSWLQKEMQKIK